MRGMHFVPLHHDLEGTYALYIPETMEIFRVSEEDRRLLERAEDDQEAEQIIRERQPELVNAGQMYERKTEGFDTLILHISNACNLKCGYCFAGHGSYSSKPGMMTEETAIAAIRTYLEQYGSIREIKLFGGEPLLNPSVMEAVGDYVRNQLHSDIVLKTITNGTILTDQIKEVIRKYGIKVVFSIDGMPLVHDQGRFDKNGAGTFDLVRKNFEELRDYTGGAQPYSIDVTYSRIHEEAGLTINDVVWYLSDTFQVAPSKINVSLIAVDEASEYALKEKNRMSESAADALERAVKGDLRTHQKLRDFIRSLKKRAASSGRVCPACSSWSAVSYEGNVYPCLMFMDRPEYDMGNIEDPFFKEKEYQSVCRQFDNRRSASCRDCFARQTCAACMGLNEFYTGSLHQSSEGQCEETRRVTDAAIQGIAEGVW